MTNRVVMYDGCDPGIEWPQPDQWTANSFETIMVLIQDGCNVLELGHSDETENEKVAIFLRDRPQYMPRRVKLRGSVKPFSRIKIGLWIGEKTELITDNWG